MLVPRNLLESLFPISGEKIIFVHTPKCGGRFVAKAFRLRFRICQTQRWPEAAGHRTYQEYRDIFHSRGKNIHDYLLFSVVRNPWDWHVSWYNYIRGDKGGVRSGMQLEHEQIRNLSFSEYLVWLDDNDIEHSDDNYPRKQVSDWVIDESGVNQMDVILRQENLEDDLLAFAEQHNFRIDVHKGRRINASRKSHDYRRYYQLEDIERVARRHARDVKMFDYRF